MLTVSAVEFQRNFGRYQDEALKQPVSITRNGRDRLVVLSIEEYQRLKRRDRAAFKTVDLSKSQLQAIIKGSIDPRHDQLNTELDQDEA